MAAADIIKNADDSFVLNEDSERISRETAEQIGKYTSIVTDLYEQAETQSEGINMVNMTMTGLKDFSHANTQNAEAIDQIASDIKEKASSLQKLSTLFQLKEEAKAELKVVKRRWRKYKNKPAS